MNIRDTTDAPQIVEHIKKSLTFTPFCTRWIPCSAKFVVLGQNPRATGAMQVRISRKHNFGSQRLVQIHMLTSKCTTMREYGRIRNLNFLVTASVPTYMCGEIAPRNNILIPADLWIKRRKRQTCARGERLLLYCPVSHFVANFKYDFADAVREEKGIQMRNFWRFNAGR